MPKNNRKPPLSPPASSSSYSSSSASSSTGEDSSPPPANSPVKKPSADFTVSVLRKHADPSSKSIAREKRHEDDGSLSTDESTEEDDSCEDSGAAVARSNPPLLIRESRNAGKQAVNTYSSDLGSEDGEEEEEDEEEDYSSKSSQQQPPPPPPPPPPQAAGSTARHNPAVPISGSNPVSEDEFENSSDSSMSAPPPPPPPPCGSSHRVADPSLMPFSSKPMDDRDQSAHKNPLPGKRLATPSSQISEKKRRTADIVGADGGQAKKEIPRRIWSKVDELSLLQCILDYKENHGVIPSTQVQLKSLLKALNDSLSTSVTLTKMNAKIRLLRNKHNNASTKIVKGAENQHVSNAHSAAVFDLLTKIWGSNTDSYVLENKIKPEIISSKEIKGKVKPFAEEYPFLHCLLMSEHPNNALVIESRIPTAKAIEFEADCKKLERAEIQLHMQKVKLLPSALKLIEDTLVEEY
ncbi:hypothetical protein KSP40_PGU005941 [Platanthera guangdongensis]|uniref:Glabrous enhancer-binding protein-like DBD domain-containing protein n=1 Tax=Platanthera guangdongensis TaxID=2320717 RepID=A0ABR2LIP9_9ASPA